jgi:hypothetical protein
VNARAGSATALALLGALLVAVLVPFAVAAPDGLSIPCTPPGTKPIVPVASGRRLPPDAEAALRQLSAASPDELPPGADTGFGHSHGSAADVAAPLTADEQALFDAQLACARRAAKVLATPEQAADAGYVQGSTYTAGVGDHWIDWTAVGKPFDPGHPSMLLFAKRRFGQPEELVGFSYWVGSAAEPAGFAGPNDHWHQHVGLCFENGWLTRQAVLRKADCPDAFVAGTNLWMLHAWVVDGVPSRLGLFSTLNPALCTTPRTAPDILRCDPTKL